MMNNTEIRATFESEEYGTLRLYYNPLEDKLLCCAKDAAKMFGYKDPSRSVRNLCRHIEKISFDTDGGVQRLNFIGREDICRLCENAPCIDPWDVCEYIESAEEDFFYDLDNGFIDCDEEEDNDLLIDCDEDDYEDGHDEGFMELLEENNAPEIPELSESTYEYLGKEFIEKFEKALDAYDYLIDAVRKALENPEFFVKAAVLVADCNAEA